MAARLPLKLGSSDQKGDDVTHWQNWAKGYAASYVSMMGPVDGYYGTTDSNFTKEMQRRLQIPMTGVFDALTASRVSYKAGTGSGVVVSPPRQRPGAWFYSMPGSGANWDVGPSLEVGKFAEEHHGFRHQGVGFAQGGYLGLMGGDSSLSYVESNADMAKSLYWLHDNNPDLQNLLQQIRNGQRLTQDLHLVYSAYSKSADGLEDWLEEAFGPGGRYEPARDWIRLVINFGNPSKQKNKDGGSPGWNPPGWGIARKIRSQWLVNKVVSVTNPLDFYAVVPDSDHIRPTFYAEIITADAELPYFVHLLNIGIQSIMQWLPIFGPLLGGLGGGLGIGMIGQMAGLAGNAGAMGALTGLLGQTGGSSHDTDVDAKLIQMFSMAGLLKTLPELIGLLQALPGLQNHGAYHVPFAELGNRSGIQVGCDLMNNLAARL